MAHREELDVGSPSGPLAQHTIGRGRLGTYAVFGACAGLLPLPWVPDVIIRQVRGSLAYDLALRHGLSLTSEARKVLEEPWTSRLPKTFVAQSARFAAGRVFGRLGPLGWVLPLRSGLATFAFGHLFVRYMEVARSEAAIRIDAEEAHTIRAMIDEALLRAVTTNAAPPWKRAPVPTDETRSGAAPVVDGFLLAAAGVPEWLLDRVDAAFDEVVGETRERP